jgi:hypothetical protein
MDPKNVKCENVDCIQLADYRDRWWDPLKIVMKFPVSLKRGSCWAAEGLPAPKNDCCPVF